MEVLGCICGHVLGLVAVPRVPISFLFDFVVYALQDVNKEAGAEDTFKKIGEAYEVQLFCSSRQLSASNIVFVPLFTSNIAKRTTYLGSILFLCDA